VYVGLKRRTLHTDFPGHGVQWWEVEHTVERVQIIDSPATGKHGTPARTSMSSTLNAAFADYAEQTGTDPAKHPFAGQLQACRSPDDVLKLFEEKANEFKAYRDGNRKLIDCLKPVVNVVQAVSGVLGEVVSTVSRIASISPARVFTTLLLLGSVPTCGGDLRWCGYSPCGACPLAFYDNTASRYPDSTGSQRG
jgi:hypothetical protein